MAQSLAATLLSGNVSPDVTAVRMAVCMTCERMRVKGAEHYCKSCRCPQWKYASLEKKNTKAGWKCPLGKHKE